MYASEMIVEAQLHGRDCVRASLCLLQSSSGSGRAHQSGECMLTRPDSHDTITKVLSSSIATTKEGGVGGRAF